jgi:hypothetical protein
VKCPHCRTAFNDAWSTHNFLADVEGTWLLQALACPECKRAVVKLRIVDPSSHGIVRHEFITYPKTSGRGPVSPDVPAKYGDDYTEACLVLADSPKASAALSRRTLQNLLRGEGGAKPGNLAGEIKQVLPKLPSYLQHIDAIRHLGNFSAHPLKDTNTGSIIDRGGSAGAPLDARTSTASPPSAVASEAASPV